MYNDACVHPSLSSSSAREREWEKDSKSVREREREGDRVQSERNAESFRVPTVLSDDMRGNEHPDFMHQKNDALHRLDCQQFLPFIGEMSPPIISFHPLHASCWGSLCRLKACISFVSLMVKFVRSLNSCFSWRCHVSLTVVSAGKETCLLLGLKSNHFEVRVS